MNQFITLKPIILSLENIITGDFLTFDIDKYFNDKIAIIGNFPYNISSQIFFKVLNHREKITEVCGMLQKEVAAKNLCKTRLQNLRHS